MTTTRLGASALAVLLAGACATPGPGSKTPGRLDADDPPLGAPEERTKVAVDLRSPGAER